MAKEVTNTRTRPQNSTTKKKNVEKLSCFDSVLRADKPVLRVELQVSKLSFS